MNQNKLRIISDAFGETGKAYLMENGVYPIFVKKVETFPQRRVDIFFIKDESISEADEANCQLMITIIGSELFCLIDAFDRFDLEKALADVEKLVVRPISEIQEILKIRESNG